MACVGIVGVIAGAAGFAGLLDWIGPRHDPFIGSVWETLRALGLMALCMTPGPVLAFIVRDWLLRRRVRFVLRTRGVCGACWYSLVGLPVGEGNKVQCPECGAITEVDESLGELVIGEDGRRRFAPNADREELARRFWTPQRVRTLRRYTLRTAAAVIIAAFVAVGGYEVFLRRQAAAARAAGGGAAKLIELVRNHQPSAAAEDNAWPFLVRAIERMEAADREVWRSTTRPVTSAGTPIDPRFDAIYGPAPDLTRARGGRSPDPEYARRCIELARQMLVRYEADGVFDQLAEAASRPSAIRPIQTTDGAPLMQLLFPELGPTRALTRVCAARMQLAFEADDPAKFRQALDQGLALARITNQQPLLIDALVGTSIEALLLERVEQMLLRSPRAEFVEAVAEAMANQPIQALGAYHIKGERLAALDNVAWVFADPARVRWGPLSPALHQALGTSTQSGRISTLAANQRAFRRHFDLLEAELTVDPFERKSSTPTTTNLALLDLLLPATTRMAESRDRMILQRRGVIAMVAIERHRHRTGSYPAALTEIPTDLLPSPPIDPYSGKSLGYRRLDTPDDRGRHYILYSVGYDGSDDGGVSGEQSRQSSGSLMVGPSDIILNEPETDSRP